MKRRGFAMLVAIGLVGLVAVVLLGLTLYVAADARRTGAEEKGAQLEQLLLAGAAVAMERGTGPVEVELPVELRQRDAELRIEPGEVASAAVITAAVDGQVVRQTVVLRRAGEGWELVEASR